MKRKWKQTGRCLVALKLVFLLILGMSLTAVGTVKAADKTELELSPITHYIQDSNSDGPRYRIDLALSDTAVRINWNQTVLVDGESSNSVLNAVIADGNLVLLIYYNNLEKGVTTAKNMGCHIIEIPAGTSVGTDLVTKNDFAIFLYGESIVYGTDAAGLIESYAMDIDSQAAQTGTEDMQRWQFNLRMSTALESTTEYGKTYGGKVQLDIYDANGSFVKTVSVNAYENRGLLGILVWYELGLPQEADGYKVVIKPTILSSTNHTYHITGEFVMINNSGTWEKVIERPEASGIRGDATADGIVDVKDIVREKAELEGLAGIHGRNGASLDSFLNKESCLCETDVLSTKEIILRQSSVKGDLPVYLQDDKIMIAAYEGPVSAKEVMLENGVTEEQVMAAFRKYADAGFNTVYAQGDAAFNSYSVMGSAGHWNLLSRYMDYAAKEDIDVIVYSEALTSYLLGIDAKYGDITKATHSELQNGKLAQELSELWNGTRINGTAYKGMKNRDNFAGLMMADEIIYANREYYTSAIDIAKTIGMDTSFLNSQLPMTASGEALKGSEYSSVNGSVLADWLGLKGGYSERAEAFTSSAKYFGSAAGQFTYDYYPLKGNGDVEKLWLYNLELSAKAGKEAGFDTGITVQAHGNNAETLRAPLETDDIGFQVYTALAYGMKSITYYTYDENSYTKAGEAIKTNEDIYNAVKRDNTDIDKFDHVFMEYDWQGTIPLEVADNDGMFTSTDKYGTISLEVYTDDRILDSSASGGDALVGCMYDPVQELNGYWLVNACNPYDNLTSTVTVKFADTARLLVYDPQSAGFDGTAEIITYDEANGYTAVLASGSGIFVIPLQEREVNDVVVEEDGTVTLRNSTGGSDVTYVYEQEVKTGQKVSIDIEVNNAQNMAAWIMDEGYVEFGIAIGRNPWTGKYTLSGTIPKDLTKVRILVRFLDDTINWKENVVTLSNLQVSWPDTVVNADGTVTLRNSTNASDLTYNLGMTAAAGSTVSFDVEFSTGNPVALWILGNGDWGKEYYANGFVNANGKKTVTATIPADVNDIQIYIQYRNTDYQKDTTSDKTGYVATISNIKVIEP